MLLRQILVYPFTAPSNHKPPRTCLLSSTDALAELEEKERKKNEVLLKKELKNAEQMEKRWKDEQKRKSQERQKKAEIKARKAEVRAKGATERKVSSKGLAPNVTLPPQKSARGKLETEDEIDHNVCFVCCILYSEDVTGGGGGDWIECACCCRLLEQCEETVFYEQMGVKHFAFLSGY